MISDPDLVSVQSAESLQQAMAMGSSYVGGGGPATVGGMGAVGGGGGGSGDMRDSEADEAELGAAAAMRAAATLQKDREGGAGMGDQCDSPLRSLHLATEANSHASHMMSSSHRSDRDVSG